MRAALQEVEIIVPVQDDGRTTVSSPMEVDEGREEISSSTREFEVSRNSRYTVANCRARIDKVMTFFFFFVAQPSVHR